MLHLLLPALASAPTWMEQLTAAAPPAPPHVPKQPPADQFEMSEFFQPLLELLWHLNPEEFIMVLLAVWPLALGTFAALKALTHNESDDDGGDGGAGSAGGEAAMAQLSSRMEAAQSTATTNLSSTIGRVEQSITDIQRNHDKRFADLHKDLAGIVWELSKLRADMARWQALAQLGARGAARATAPGAARSPTGGGALPVPERLPPDTNREEGAAMVRGAGGSADAAGARAWRGDATSSGGP